MNVDVGGHGLEHRIAATAIEGNRGGAWRLGVFSFTSCVRPNGKEPPFNRFIRGQGLKGWPGWYDNPEIERLSDAWLTANTDAELDHIYDAIQESALASPPFVPLGQFSVQTAYRSDLVGVTAGASLR